MPAGPARVIALARRERPSRPAASRAIADERADRPLGSPPKLRLVGGEHAKRPVEHDLHGALVRDPALVRVREAGGPSDLACYTCACGYVFRAPVSTSVVCPNCEATQAW